MKIKNCMKYFKGRGLEIYNIDGKDVPQKFSISWDVLRQSLNSLAKFDALLRRSVQRITNSDLTDIPWI